MKVCFVLNDLALSGGVGVVIEHAHRLAKRRDFDVTVAVAGDAHVSWGYQGLQDLAARPLGDVRDEHFDVAVATWWNTAYHVFDLSADRYVYFVQSLEDRFYLPEELERVAAALTHRLPFAFITEARWIADALAQLQPKAPCFYVRNGVEKAVFGAIPAPQPRTDGPLRLLIEGHEDVWFKALPDAADAVGRMREARTLTYINAADRKPTQLAVDRIVGPVSQRELAQLLAETDVLVKLSRVEGMFGPPLEGFHAGATCVVTPVTGHDEYIVHGWNGLVVDWDDPGGTAHSLDLLARDRSYLHFLRSNAYLTAKGWPSWEQANQLMAMALKTICRLPPAKLNWSPAGLLADVRGGIYAHRARQQDLAQELEQASLDLTQTTNNAIYWQQQFESLRQTRSYRIGLKLRRRWNNPLIQALRTVAARRRSKHAPRG